jgi:hypothetical protein
VKIVEDWAFIVCCKAEIRAGEKSIGGNRERKEVCKTVLKTIAVDEIAIPRKKNCFSLRLS